VINCIFCASYIFFKRISQTPINHSFKDRFFQINQTKNFLNHVLKSVLMSIELLKRDANVVDEDVTECVLCEDCEVD